VDQYAIMVGSGDFMDTVRDIMVVLMNNYRVMFYNGNYDGICGVATTDAFLRSLHWKGTSAYASSKRSIWKIRSSDDEVAGYARELYHGDFARVVVRNAGHLLPTDQPERALDMITRFITRRGFST
jgi:vitellogenic carboxypeptidase-like protein